MINLFIRGAKRFAVLLPGFVIAYFSVRNIFPYFDRRLPLGLAIIVTYILGAYILIPALTRVFRILFPAQHLPVYCVTPDGFASDPINIGIIASRQGLIQAMEAAGWYVADDYSPFNVLRALVSTVLLRKYPNAPMSRLYLFGRKQDLGFEIPIDGEIGHRHHVRFWATTYDPARPLSARTIHWHHHRADQQADNLLWLGAASRDIGFAFIRHNAQMTHMIHADTDAERQFIVDGIRRTGLIDNSKAIRVGKPYSLVNRAWRGQLNSDGILMVLKLRWKPKRVRAKKG